MVLCRGKANIIGIEVIKYEYKVKNSRITERSCGTGFIPIQ
jgi:hypothetical protein